MNELKNSDLKKVHNFRELKIWKESLVLVKNVYLLTSKLPKDEKFGLVSQINRCAVSIPSNIAEGSGRTTEKEFLYFLNIAISSSYELETQLILIEDIFQIQTKSILMELETLQKMIGAFKRILKTEK
ncbi:MAG: four helix bundle protein [Crocinitomicaceae bacterium]|nr:four helix bundle protein [Crocinitomicaceae bacterium]MDP5009887.1 four helix bundle protein [Crocinitomicaceae bacterium]